MIHSFLYNAVHPAFRAEGLQLRKVLVALMVTAMGCLGILPATAQDNGGETIRFTVIIPNSEAVICNIMGADYPLHDGSNEFEVAETTTVYFASVYPWKFTSIKDRKGKKPSGFYGSDWYLYVDSGTRDEIFSIDLANINDLRTAQFTLTVDDPTLVNATMTGYGASIDLKAGENTVRFEPNVETYLNLSPTDNSTPFYSVRLNGTAVAPQGISYGIPLQNGCIIDVTAILPDEERTVTFSYTAQARNSIILLVNDKEVTQFDGNTLAVRLGDKLTIQERTTYKINEVKVNGRPISFYGSYSFFVMEATRIHIDARPYDTIPVTVIVNDPELIQISSNGESFDLNAGENLIQLPETNTVLMWTVSPTAIINSVSVNGKDPLPAYMNSYTLEKGDVIAFDISPKVFDMQAIVWVDNTSGKACSTYLDFNSQTDRSVRYTLENGYNLVDFYRAMNPFDLNWGGYDPENPDASQTGKAYLNGTLLVAEDGGSGTYHSVTLADGDVLKLFMDSEPETCSVAFEIAEGLEATVVKDVITRVINPSDGFECFAGTLVGISGKDLKVTVNGQEISVDDDGKEFGFTVKEAATVVAITSSSDLGVDTAADKPDADVFNMHGIKVGTMSSMDSLAPGLYITQGRKVAVG